MKPYFSYTHHRGDGTWALTNLYSDVGGYIAKFHDEELAKITCAMLNGHATEEQREAFHKYYENMENELYKKFEDEGII